MENRLLSRLHRQMMQVTRLMRVVELDVHHLMYVNEPVVYVLLLQEGVQTGSLTMVVQCVGAAIRKTRRRM